MKTITTLAALAAFTFASISSATPVNINSANAAEIAAALNGVGMSKAQAIVDHRATNGLFSNAEQLVAVRGIGNSILQKIKQDILLK